MALPIPIERTRIAAGIARVSLEKQAKHGWSLDGQVEEFGEIAEQWKVEIPQKYVIVDDGYEGSDFTRPSVRKVLRLIETGEINAVVFPHSDRFSRDVPGGWAYIRALMKAGADVLIANLGWFERGVADSELDLRFNIAMSLAQKVKADIREKSRKGVKQKVSQGWIQASRLPYGWRVVTKAELVAQAIDAGRPRPDKAYNTSKRVPGEIAVIPKIFTLAIQGKSARAICRYLIETGIPTRRGGPWHPEVVTEILERDVYCTGEWQYGKTENCEPDPDRIRKRENRHKVKSSRRKMPQSRWSKPIALDGGPVISRATFEAAQEAMKRNDRLQRGRPTTEGRLPAMLRGMLRCGCKSSMCQWQKKRRTRIDRYYRCTNRDRVTGCSLCTASSTMVQAERLEETVWAGLREALLEKLPALIKAHRASLLADVDENEVARLEKQEAKLARTMTEAANKELDADDEDLKRVYAGRVKQTLGELKLLRRRLAAARAENATAAVVVDVPAIQYSAAKAMDTKDPAERREVVAEFVDSITYHAAEKAADMWLRLPLSGGAKCQSQQPTPDNFVLLKHRIQVAA